MILTTKPARDNDGGVPAKFIIDHLPMTHLVKEKPKFSWWFQYACEIWIPTIQLVSFAMKIIKSIVPFHFCPVDICIIQNVSMAGCSASRRAVSVVMNFPKPQAQDPPSNKICART
jgi:hypothetical protein